MSINISNISFGYELQKMVLHNISFDLEKGKTLAIVGASGCGKSTLLRMISGILPCTNDKQKLHGTILIDNLTPDQYRKTGKLAFMFQEATLMPHLTVKENIAFPLKIAKKENDDEVQGLMQMVGLSDYANYLPKQLSGGMKTRVALARSFSTNPELLLLDEPFSALDIAWKSKLYVELEKLKKQNNTTVIIVTHDIQEALLLADNVYVLNKRGAITNREEIVFEKNKITNIAEFTSSSTFHKAFSSIQKWIIDDGVRSLTENIEIKAILDRIHTAVKDNLDIWENFDMDVINLRKFSKEKNVHEKLYDSFMLSNNPLMKIQLIWDILEYEEIDINRVNKVIDFCFENMDILKPHELKYYNVAEDKIFDVIVNSRIKSENYTNNKRWVYLFDLNVSNDREKVIKYLEEVLQGNINELNYELAKKVAHRLLKLNSVIA